VDSGGTVAFLVRAGLFIVSLQLNVSGSAPFWHTAGTGTLSMRTVGRPLLADRNCRGARAGSTLMPLAIYGPILHCPCCRQVLLEGVR
jgi:hypothetical protein